MSREEPAGLWDGDTMIGPRGPLNDEQVAAVSDRERPLLLEASAGAGKTMVLVERFVRDVLEGEGGLPLECDEVLAITFTRKAAGELRERIRRRLAGVAATGGPLAPRARECLADLDGAWISTIDSFCSRLLRRHALLAGVDPAFELLDEADGLVLQQQAFATAASAALAGPDRDRLLDLFAVDGYGTIRDEVTALHERLRSEGSEFPEIPLEAPAEDGWLALLGRLLVAYGAAYAAARAEAGACDFADVIYAVIALLDDNPELAAGYRERFRRVLIDEFQDTSRLQMRLFDALGVEQSFQVGDPLQSIYGWRDADVAIFLDRAAEQARAGGTLKLTTNYRSHREILEIVNAASHEAHEASGIEWVDIGPDPESSPDREGAPRVELMVTDSRADWKGAGLTPLKAEARLVAGRIRRLLDEPGPTGEKVGQGEVVILMESRSAMALYRDELARVGIESVLDGGDDWWSRPELGDLTCHLRVVANRRDDEAILHALRSPACGVGVEALVLLGALKEAGEAGGLFAAFEGLCDGSIAGPLAASLPAADLERMQGYRELLGRWSELARHAGAGEVVDAVIADSGYPAALLALPDGEQMLANVRQLAAVAHGWDRRRGGGLRDFLRWARAVAEGRTRETDAPVGGLLDEEGRPDPRGPVRMMTIHAAKGLEFPYVVLPRLGSGARPVESRILVVDGRAGCRLRVAGTGGDDGFEGPFGELLATVEERSGLERRRKVHVALTRAEEMLVMSGAGDPAILMEPGDDEPVGGAPVRWISRALLGEGGDELLDDGGDRVEVEVDSAGRSGRLALTVCRPDVAGTLFGEERGLGGARKEGGPAAAPPPRAEPGVPVPPTVSYSELSRYSECAYRWYLEKVAGLPQRENDGFTDDSGGARARGTVAHRLLESLAFSDPEEVPGPERVRAVAATVTGARTDDRAVAEQVALVEAFVASGLWSRLARVPQVERESDFAIEIDPGDASLPVLIGTIDVLADEGDGTALVVDYKSDAVSPDDDLDLKVEDRYALQRDAYALAALSRGFERVEVAYCFLARPDDPVAATFTAADQEKIAARLAEAARGMVGEGFPVSGRPGPGLCTGCPGRPLKGTPGLCSHSFEETAGGG